MPINITSSRKFDCMIRYSVPKTAYYAINLYLSIDTPQSLVNEIKSLEQNKGIRITPTPTEPGLIQLHVNACWDADELVNTIKQAIESEGLLVEVKKLV